MVSFVFSDFLNPGYILVNVSVDAHISSHEVSDLDPLELVFADDCSNGHLLPGIVQRETDRDRHRHRDSYGQICSLQEPCSQLG